MSVVDIATLKSYFQTGDFPTEQQFIDLIDTLDSPIKEIRFTYNFAVNGGSIGSKLMGVFLPAGAELLFCNAIPLTNLASSGLATVDIGVVGSTQKIFGNASQGSAGNFGDYNAGSWGFANGIGLAPYDILNTNAIVPIAASVQVVVTIGGFALTAGKFNCSIFYRKS